MKRWTDIEISDLLEMTDEEFHLKYPNRTLKAIIGKRSRLRSNPVEKIYEYIDANLEEVYQYVIAKMD